MQNEAGLAEPNENGITHFVGILGNIGNLFSGQIIIGSHFPFLGHYLAVKPFRDNEGRFLNNDMTVIASSVNNVSVGNQTFYNFLGMFCRNFQSFHVSFFWQILLFHPIVSAKEVVHFGFLCLLLSITVAIIRHIDLNAI
nr:MAG TPA: hypothetical protein [Bacteriophage sp.]